MPRISRSTLLVSVAILLALVAVACDGSAEKPTAEPEPPTPVPTVVESESIDTDATGSARTSGARGDVAASFADPEVQECLASELGIELGNESAEFDPGTLRQLDPGAVSSAFEECGVEFGRPGGGVFVGGGITDPIIRDCLTDILGDDALDNLGRGSGLGLEPESLAAFEECGINFGDGAGGLRFGGREGGFGDGLRGGITLDGSFFECMTEELGEDALTQLRNPSGAPSAEVQAALTKCGGGIAIPVEPDGGIGDGAGPIPVEPEEVPTATAIPASELTIEQLTCLSSELEPAALASAVVATSSGDLSEITGEVLAALETCGVGS